MREIKFRARPIDSHEWIYGGGVQVFGDKIVILHANSNNNPTLTIIDPKSVGQCTSLKDKNDIEIYEGDIVLIPDDETVPITDEGAGPKDPANHLAPIIFTNGCFGPDIQESADYYEKGFTSFSSLEGAEYLEVIGNIYSNPDIMQGHDSQQTKAPNY